MLAVAFPQQRAIPVAALALEPGARSDQANDQSLPWWEGVEKKFSLALVHSAQTNKDFIDPAGKDVRLCTSLYSVV